jgi:hypothetical protein
LGLFVGCGDDGAVDASVDDATVDRGRDATSSPEAGFDGGRADGARFDGGGADGGRADGARFDGGGADGGRADDAGLDGALERDARTGSVPADGGASHDGTVMDSGARDGATSTVCASLAPDVRPYDPRAFLVNRVIPASPALDPRSADIVAELDAHTASRRVELGTDGETPTVYTVSASDALYTVTGPTPIAGRQFRVPSSAMPGRGADYPIEILDPEHGTLGPYVELRLWQASIDHAAMTIEGSGGGLFHYNNDGANLDPGGAPSVATAFEGYGTGSGLSYLAGLIRPEEVAAGEICHAVRFSYSTCDFTDTHRAPATRTDQPMASRCAALGPVASRMEMGMRLQLDPTVDCDARTVPARNAGQDVSEATRFLRMFCRALQRYGMIVLDGTSDEGVLFYAEDDLTADWESELGPPDPYTEYSYILRDQDSPSDGLSRDASSGIPWHRLRVLAAGAVSP